MVFVFLLHETSAPRQRQRVATLAEPARNTKGGLLRRDVRERFVQACDGSRQQ